MINLSSSAFHHPVSEGLAAARTILLLSVTSFNKQLNYNTIFYILGLPQALIPGIEFWIRSPFQTRPTLLHHMPKHESYLNLDQFKGDTLPLQEFPTPTPVSSSHSMESQATGTYISFHMHWFLSAYSSKRLPDLTTKQFHHWSNFTSPFFLATRSCDISMLISMLLLATTLSIC